MNEEPDGTIIVCGSTDHVDFKMPEKSGTVRAETPLSGMLFKPNPQDPKKTIVYICNEIDLKAGIPEFAMR